MIAKEPNTDSLVPADIYQQSTLL